MQRGNKISKSKALAIAENAKQYARQKIKKGSTQLENNELEPVFFDALIEGIGNKEDMYGVRDVIRERTKAAIDGPLRTDTDLASYQSKIAVTSKYSIGNCQEIALQALDYILRHDPSEMTAEAFYIDGGDHYFIVLNRNPDSDPDDIDHWGADAIICDPWADSVFSASEYPDNLNAFRRRGRENQVYAFDHNVHELMLDENMNKHYLLRQMKLAAKKSDLLKNGDELKKTLLKNQEKLEADKGKLMDKHDYDDVKVRLLDTKIRAIGEMIRRIDKQTERAIILTKRKGHELDEHLNLLDECFDTLKKEASDVVKFNKEEQALLSQGQSRWSSVMTLFDVAHVKEKKQGSHVKHASEKKKIK